MPGAQIIEKVSHIHECIINEMVADPLVTQKELCERFAYSAGWMSRLINSDSFQARLAERREQLLDPMLKARLKDKMESVVMQSLSTIQHKLNAPEASADLAMASLGVLQQGLQALNGSRK